MLAIPLPKSWKEITLQKFSDLDLILKDEDLDASAKDLKILTLLIGKSEGEILALPFKTKHLLLKKMSFLYDLGSIQPKVHKYFSLKGKRFRFILNTTELSGGQYIDLMTFLKDPDALNQNIHNVLAVIASPMKFGILKTKYNGKKHEALARFFYENMSVAIAYPALVFFCKLSEHLTLPMADYLRRETTTQMNQIQTQLQDFRSAMAGSSSSTPSATATAPHGIFINASTS